MGYRFELIEAYSFRLALMALEILFLSVRVLRDSEEYRKQEKKIATNSRNYV
jgi:hypothetical protein